jgi:membrane-associated phospholipid phosphatase
VAGIHTDLLRRDRKDGLPNPGGGKHPYSRLEEVGSLDADIMRFMVAHRTPALTGLAEAVETAGDSRQVLGLLAFAGLALVIGLRAYRVGAAAVLALAVSWVVADSLKALVQRPRPDLALIPLDGWAMPSGHAARTLAVSVAVLVAAGWSASGERRPAALALLWAVVAVNVAIGVFMVYLGAHWPTDVLAGWVLGAAIGWAAGRLCSVRARRAARSAGR